MHYSGHICQQTGYKESKSFDLVIATVDTKMLHDLRDDDGNTMNKKRKTTTQTQAATATPATSFSVASKTSEKTSYPMDLMFIQTACDDFANGYLVPIDPLQHKLVYENVMQFDKSDNRIEIYLPFLGSPVGDTTVQAWTEFCHSEYVKSHEIESKASNLAKIAQARWWVWYTHV
jgi:hypothetical protein